MNSTLLTNALPVPTAPAQYDATPYPSSDELVPIPAPGKFAKTLREIVLLLDAPVPGSVPM